MNRDRIKKYIKAVASVLENTCLQKKGINLTAALMKWENILSKRKLVSFWFYWQFKNAVKESQRVNGLYDNSFVLDYIYNQDTNVFFKDKRLINQRIKKLSSKESKQICSSVIAVIDALVDKETTPKALHSDLFLVLSLNSHFDQDLANVFICIANCPTSKEIKAIVNKEIRTNKEIGQYENTRKWLVFANEFIEDKYKLVPHESAFVCSPCVVRNFCFFSMLPSLLEKQKDNDIKEVIFEFIKIAKKDYGISFDRQNNYGILKAQYNNRLVSILYENMRNINNVTNNEVYKFFVQYSGIANPYLFLLIPVITINNIISTLYHLSNTDKKMTVKALERKAQLKHPSYKQLFTKKHNSGKRKREIMNYYCGHLLYRKAKMNYHMA